MDTETENNCHVGLDEAVRLQDALEQTGRELRASQRALIAAYEKLLAGQGDGPSKFDMDRLNAAAAAREIAVDQYEKYLVEMTNAEVHRAAMVKGVFCRTPSLSFRLRSA